jgi:hypothetical protein
MKCCAQIFFTPLRVGLAKSKSPLIEQGEEENSFHETCKLTRNPAPFPLRIDDSDPNLFHFCFLFTADLPAKPIVPITQSADHSAENAMQSPVEKPGNPPGQHTVSASR